MTPQEFANMQAWENLQHKVAVQYAQELMHFGCLMANFRPNFLGCFLIPYIDTEGSKPRVMLRPIYL